jgi:MYXO-CTERM domain-containing protein
MFAPRMEICMKSVSSTIVALAFAACLTGPVHAQDETPTPAATVTQVDRVETRNDDGPPWGLLGLLGLAGLAGLRRQQPEVRTVERRVDPGTINPR